MTAQIRISLPSKGRLAEDSLSFLSACGLRVEKTNPRQYEACIPSLPELTVLFQRPADIVVSVRDGSVDFGLTGLDVIAERRGENGELLILHDNLGFGRCSLALAVPEAWEGLESMEDLQKQALVLDRPLRIATKYPALTAQFLDQRGIPHRLISAEGTLETAPAIGYADLIADLVSSGQTLKDNRLRQVSGGTILVSQAALIANRKALRRSPQVLAVARQLLEFIEAHLRAQENVAIFANIRGETPEMIAGQLFAQATIGGLQGPTISRVIVREGDGSWFAVHIIVRRETLFQAVAELRAIGGSGVVVTPVTYIFEEVPPRYRAMLAALEDEHAAAL
jgi:ATP phosphoribosyltransferase